MFGHPAARGTQEVQGVCAISSGALCTPRQVCWLFFFPFPCLSPHLLRVKTSDSCWLIIIQEHWPIIDQDHLHSPLGVCLLPQDQKKKKKKGLFLVAKAGVACWSTWLTKQAIFSAVETPPGGGQSGPCWMLYSLGCMLYVHALPNQFRSVLTPGWFVGNILLHWIV